MAPQLRSEFPVSGGGVSPRQATWTTPPATNDLILLEIATAADVVPVAPVDFWPISRVTITGAIATRVYWKLATASEPNTYTVTFPGGGDGNIGMCSIFPQTDPYVYIHDTDTATGSSSSVNKVFDAVEPTVANTLFLCFGAWTNADSTPHASMTERYDSPGTDCRIYLMTQNIAATGSTGTRTATGSAVTTRRMISIDVRESLGKPSMNPVFAVFDDDTGLDVFGHSVSSSHQWQAQSSNAEGIDEAGGVLFIAPPPDTVRLTATGIATFIRTRTNGISSASGSMGTRNNPFTSVTDDFVFSAPAYGVLFIQPFNVEWTLPSSADWPVNNQSLYNSPPGSGSASGFDIFVNANGTTLNTATATGTIVLRVREIELRDGTIIYPDATYVTSFGTLVEIESESELVVTSYGTLVEILFVEPPEPSPTMPTRFPSNTGTRALHRILPGEISGYAFDPELSWWTIVLPEKTENLIVNPSFEVYETVGYDWNTPGWQSVDIVDNAPVGATHDLRCLKLVGNSLGVGEFWYEGDAETGGITHVTPGPYTWSLDVYVYNPAAAFELEFRYAGGATIRKKRFSNITSGWNRYYLTYVETGTGDIELVFRDVGISGLLKDIYYLDGWQLEKKLYNTTYCDGDKVGFYDVSPKQSYYWTGLPHRSISVRKANTASGGKEISLSDEFGLMTTAIIGLGMSPVEHITQQLASGKELYRGSKDLPRDFTITAKLFGENWTLLSQKRNQLISYLRPNNTAEREPLLLRYQPTDDKGVPYGEPLEIICAYSSGLQGNVTNLYQETLAMQFHSSLPFLAETIDSAILMLLELDLSSMGLAYRDADMEYQNIDEGTVGGADFGNVSQVAFAYDNMIVMAIEVTGDTNDLDYSGVAPRQTNFLIARRDENNEYQWEDFGTGVITEGEFYALSADPAHGFFVLGGDFLRTDTGVDWNHIVVGLLVDVTPVTEGIIGINNMPDGLNDVVWAIDYHGDGAFYVGGEFTDVFGAATDAYFHIFRLMTDIALGEAFAQDMLGGVGGIVYSVMSDKSRYVYIGGVFANAYNDVLHIDAVGANNIIIYDTLEDAWIPMGTVNYIGVNGSVNDIEMDEDGTLYIIGNFLSYASTTIPLSKIGRWNGYTWVQPFDFGILWELALDAKDVRFEIAPDGILWFYSRDTAAGFTGVPTIGDCHLFGWKDGIFYAPFYEVDAGSQAISDLRFLPTGEMLITFRELGDSLRVPYLNRLTYAGGADTYPTLVLTTAKPQFIINHTVSSSIYFRSDFALNNLERMRIDLSSIRANIFSNLRPNMANVVQSGATNLADFRLMPGENRISVFMREHTAGAEGAIVWRNQFWSMDATVANELHR